jgi:hypothetical protein
MNTLRKFHIAGFVLVYNDCDICESDEPVVFEADEFEKMSADDVLVAVDHPLCWEKEFAYDCV